MPDDGAGEATLPLEVTTLTDGSQRPADVARGTISSGRWDAT
jgi:hypothetical protein